MPTSVIYTKNNWIFQEFLILLEHLVRITVRQGRFERAVAEAFRKYEDLLIEALSPK